MIVLLTDYGYQGPYVGQLKAKILEYSPTAIIIDLMHDLPVFDLQAAASLIPAITKMFPKNSIFICVVDPGVGSNRKCVLIETRFSYYIGPDNGIFDKLVTSGSQNTRQWEILWRPRNLSNSFHGRDLFVPIACQLYNKTLNYRTQLREFKLEKKLHHINKEYQIIYFDGFGNAITSIKVDEVNEKAQLIIADNIISYSRVFSEIAMGEFCWYKNSMDLVEIACNQASAKERLTLSIGQMINIV